MRVGLTYWRPHDRPALGRRYLAARPSAKAGPAPRLAGARGGPVPEGIHDQLEVLAGTGVYTYIRILRIRPCICMRDLELGVSGAKVRH